jgi:hypothetical protein
MEILAASSMGLLNSQTDVVKHHNNINARCSRTVKGALTPQGWRLDAAGHGGDGDRNGSPTAAQRDRHFAAWNAVGARRIDELVALLMARIGSSPIDILDILGA